MREMHGVADAKKIMMVGETDDITVKVYDRGCGKIGIGIGTDTASLTIEQADLIWRELSKAIKRAGAFSGQPK